MACLKGPRCVIEDDANPIVAQMEAAEVICFATPVYYYEMSGQMKTLLDRANHLFTADYAFRDIYLLTASAEEEDSASDGPVNGLEGWIACFETVSYTHLDVYKRQHLCDAGHDESRSQIL